MQALSRKNHGLGILVDAEAELASGDPRAHRLFVRHRARTRTGHQDSDGFPKQSGERNFFLEHLRLNIADLVRE